MGKVHCGENLCLLIGHCGENTHICTNNTLSGKSVRPSWSLWRKKHLYAQMIHCGESALWGKSVRVCVLVGRCGENTHIRINDTLWGKVHCGENLCVLVGRCWSLYNRCFFDGK